MKNDCLLTLKEDFKTLLFYLFYNKPEMKIQFYLSASLINNFIKRYKVVSTEEGFVVFEDPRSSSCEARYQSGNRTPAIRNVETQWERTSCERVQGCSRDKSAGTNQMRSKTSQGHDEQMLFLQTFGLLGLECLMRRFFVAPLSTGEFSRLTYQTWRRSEVESFVYQ